MIRSLGCRALAVAAVAAVMAGCSGSGAQMPIDQAAASYLAAVCPANAAAAEVGTLVADWASTSSALTSAEVATLSTASGTIADGAKALRNPPAAWPSDVADDVVAVAADMDAVSVGMDDMAASSSQAGAYAIWQDSQPGSSVPFDAVRAGLGLPPDGPDNGCPAS